MPVITNPYFGDGLNGWFYSDGITAVTIPPAEDETIPSFPGAIIPGTGELGQFLGEVILSHHHLTLAASPLRSERYYLQFRFDYIDGTHTSHDTEAVVDIQPGYLSSIIVPVDTTKHLRQFKITNMNVHEDAAIFVSVFVLHGEFVTDDDSGSGFGAEPRFMKRREKMWMDQFNLRLFSMEKKLDGISELLRNQKPHSPHKKQTHEKKRK